MGGQAGLFSGGCSEDAEAGERKTFICFCPKQSGHLQAGKFRMLFCGRPDYRYISINYNKLHFAETRVSKTLEEMKNATVVAGVAVCASVCACACVRVCLCSQSLCARLSK